MLQYVEDSENNKYNFVVVLIVLLFLSAPGGPPTGAPPPANDVTTDYVTNDEITSDDITTARPVGPVTAAPPAAVTLGNPVNTPGVPVNTPASTPVANSGTQVANVGTQAPNDDQVTGPGAESDPADDSEGYGYGSQEGFDTGERTAPDGREQRSNIAMMQKVQKILADMTEEKKMNLSNAMENFIIDCTYMGYECYINESYVYRILLCPNQLQIGNVVKVIDDNIIP